VFIQLSLDFHQREFNALMMVADVLVNKIKHADEQCGPDNDRGSMHADRNGEYGRNNSADFGLRISTQYASILIAEDEQPLIDSLVNNIGSGPENTSPFMAIFDRLCAVLVQLRCDVASNVDASANSNMSSEAPMQLCVSIRQPLFELFSSNQRIFVAVKANDLSIFEMTTKQFHALNQQHFDFQQPDAIALRLGDSKHTVPVIQRSSQLSTGADSISNSRIKASLLGNHQRFGHAFEVRLDLTSATTSKQLEIFVDFFDILWNFDPASLWLLKLVAFLSPHCPKELLQMHVDAVAGEIEALREHWENDTGLVQEIASLCTQLQEAMCHDDSMIDVPERDKEKAVSSPFEMTKVLVRVRDSQIDYCDAQNHSLASLSVGLLTLATTVVSDSSRIALKITLKDLGMDLAPLPLRPTAQCRPVQSLRVLALDQLSMLLKIRDRDEEELRLQISFGNCCLSGAADSLLLFGVSD
jgi:hypothetical protein